MLLGRLKGQRRKDKKDGRIDGEKRRDIDRGEGAKREMELIGFPCLNFRIARIRQESSEGSKDQRGALSCLHRARQKAS